MTHLCPERKRERRTGGWPHSRASLACVLGDAGLHACPGNQFFNHETFQQSCTDDAVVGTTVQTMRSLSLLQCRALSRCSANTSLPSNKSTHSGGFKWLFWEWMNDYAFLPSVIIMLLLTLRNCSRNTKYSQVWWLLSVILALGEAEAGGLP